LTDGLQSRNTTNLSDAYITITEALHTYFAIGDMGEDGYRSMLCVESANTADNRIMIAPNGSHTLSVCYSVKTNVQASIFQFINASEVVHIVRYSRPH